MAMDTPNDGQSSSLNATEPARPIHIAYGQATPESAVIRIACDDDSVSLSGTIRGPESAYANTLPTTQRFPTDPSQSNLGSVTIRIPDPCFWSPLLPIHYRIQVDAARDGQPVWSSNRILGIRRLGVRGKHIFLEGKRIVFRAVAADAEADMQQWRSAAAGMWSDSRSSDLLAAASKHGVLTMVSIRGDRSEVQSQLADLSRWPAVGFGLVECSEPLEINQLAPNILLATSQPAALGNWASILVVPHDQLSSVDPSVFNEHPVFATRLHAEQSDVLDARTKCDRLQAELAPDYDLAGYLV